MKQKTIVFAAIVLVIYACSPKPYGSTNKMYRERSKSLTRQLLGQPVDPVNDTIKQPAYWVGTTNFNLRKPSFVIIHHTAQHSCPETLTTFTTPRSAVSAHYVICKDGTVHHMLNDYLRAAHAGVSRWGNLIDVNSSSIGIELDNNGFQSFDSLQINSLLSLLGRLKSEYAISAANFIGHSDIAPARKVDPNVYFPWKKLADKGFGLWFDDTRDSVPAGFNHIQALRMVGYDVKDTTAAIRAFKRHFMQDTTRRINEADKSVLYNLQKKYM
ncbi:N-acetylmuramoyl-L-alanine amidase [Sediminibacterium soli]|uniref:N-acetylmuramoyl-L-alanine amidase n=1 Tax=Sediminibacterium soli TaxID=2698829 RepID=UPI001379F474|nr:N-acetylmuramoyl-L-alanine amidase [Sediminibacterium soli]NCI46369.1 N-acetylmuramoyl-L-alanine amidase [Sediminibacterium soli]